MSSSVPSPTPLATVYLVEDDAACRQALAEVLQSASYRVVACGSAEAFFGERVGSEPGCVILDLRLPGLGGIEALEEITRQREAKPVIVLSGIGDVATAVEAMEKGAFTFLQKPVAPSKLLEKVRQAVERDRAARRRVGEAAAVRECYGRLTQRERQVVALLVQGKRARAIAIILGTAESTVRVQRASILRKMHADSPTDLLRMLIDADLADELFTGR